MPVANRERVAVERAHRRAGDAVALGVVLAAVARTAEAGDRDRRDQRDVAELLSSSSRSSGPFGCTGQPRCAQWFEMIVKLGRPLSSWPLYRTNAVRRETVPWRQVAHERRDDELALREVRERADVVSLLPCFRNAGPTMKPSAGSGDDAADHGAEAERRGLEELRARVAVLGRDRAVQRGAPRAAPDSGSTSGACRELGAGGQVAHPEEREDGAPGPRRPPTTHHETISPTSRTTIADGEADRPQARAGDVRMFVVVRLQAQTGFNLVVGTTVNVVTGGANSDGNRGRHARGTVGRSRTRPSGDRRAHGSPRLISISGGHSRAPSSGPFAVASMPSLPPKNWQRRGVVEVVERPFGEHDVALRVDVRADVEHHLGVVVHVDVRVDDDDALRQAEHPEAPDRVHHLARVARERLADRDDAEVVERAGDRQVVVDDLGHRQCARPAGRSARSPCRARHPPAAACRRRSRGRSRRAASSAR